MHKLLQLLLLTMSSYGIVPQGTLAWVNLSFMTGTKEDKGREDKLWIDSTDDNSMVWSHSCK